MCLSNSVCIMCISVPYQRLFYWPQKYVRLKKSVHFANFQQVVRFCVLKLFVYSVHYFQSMQ